MYISKDEYAAQALKAFTATGAKMPTEVQTAIDHADAIRTFVAANLVGNNLGAAIVAAIKAGADPATDTAVVAATQRAVWSNPTVSSGINTAPMKAITAAIVGHADALIAALRPLFDAAVGELRDAHAILGDVALREDPALVLARGSVAASAWGKAIAAVETTDSITAAWSTIARTAGIPENLYAASMVEWDADTWVATHHEGRRHQVGADAWAAIRRGWTLRLADRADLREFEAEVAEAEQRAREAAEKRNNRSPIFQTR